MPPLSLYSGRDPHEAAAAERPSRRTLAESRRLTGTPGVILAAARKLFERDGVRATKETAACLNDHVAKEYAAWHHLEIELVYEMFCLVVFGLVGLVKVNPRISDEDLMKVVEQTLRLDMTPLDAPSPAMPAAAPAADGGASPRRAG